MSPRKVHAVLNCSSLPMLQLLVETHGADSNVEYAGDWPLKTFATKGDCDAVAWLLAHGAKPDFTATGETALHAAVANDHLECAQLLLEAKANPNQQDVAGCVPMYRLKSEGMLDLLLSFGADPTIGDQCGFKPSHWVEKPELKARLKSLERAIKKASPRKTDKKASRRK